MSLAAVSDRVEIELTVISDFPSTLMDRCFDRLDG
jgi:hypothetical protein